jgi:dTDP-4-dehydrorhamnose reductase
MSDAAVTAVMVTGASGLLGQWLLRTAPWGCPIVAATHRRPVDGVASVRVDLRDRAAVTDVVTGAAPALVVHAAYARDESSVVDATRHVVEAARDVGAPVLHTSSDAVFSGDGVVRDEHALPDARMDYGRWKATAERIVLDASPHNVVVRLPLLVSTDPDDHAVAQMRAAVDEGRPSRWFADEFRRPAMASEIAAALWRIVALPAGERSGVWHLAGPQRVSRFDIAERMAARLGLPPASVESDLQPPGTDRPRDLEFSDQRARRAIGWDPSPIG